jgi:xylulokinase
VTRYVIGCDVGSQGTNAALYADDGTLVKQRYHAYDLSYPAPAWAEQAPSDWIAGVTATVRELAASVPDESIAAISFGTQLDGMVVCDERCRPLRPAMIWMDRRAEAQAAWLADRMDPADFYRRSGVNLDSSHAAFKALWVRDNEPDVYAAARWLLSPGAWVLHGVTGVVAVDPSNASSTGLLDPRTRRWSDALLDATGIDGDRLAPIRPAPEPVGTVTAAFADATGLSPSTAVATGCGDEMAATLGAGVFEPGEVCDVVGTAEPVCAVSAGPREDPSRLVECHPHADPATWLLENPGFVSGGNLRWWRDGFCPEERAAEAAGDGDAYDLLCRAAAQVPPGADGLTFLPCMQGAMAPEWNGAARGAFAGLSLAHSKAHMTRAILEGSAFALRDILEAMRSAGLDVRRITMVGGGARGALWRRIKADVTGLPVRVPTNVETTATGAAVLAAVAAGMYPDVASAASAFVTYEPAEDVPDPDPRAAYDEAYRRYRDVYFGLAPVYGSAT